MSGGSKHDSDDGQGSDRDRGPGERRGAAARDELIADRYRLLTRLGRGSLGEVWSGRDLRLHRDVAVKIFRGGPSSGGLPDWLRREGVAAAQIIHPNVAVIHDQGTDSERLYLVMELVAGATLHQVLHGGWLPVRDAVEVAAQVCSALAAAHGAGVVHRDIKPQNVLVKADGTVKVVDFGIAGFLNDTRSWSVARLSDAVKGSGTPEYAAPEQILGQNADARSDLYSVGTLLYAMLAGQVPFLAENFLAVMHRKVTEDPPDVREARPDLPSELVDLVRALLAREPGERPLSAREVAARLRDVAAALGRAGESRPQVEVEGRGGVEGSVGGDCDDAGVRSVGDEREAEAEAEADVEESPPSAPSSDRIVEQRARPSEPWTPQPPEPPLSPTTAASPPATPSPPVWGSSPKDPDPAAATAATMLSPLAPREIRGRSLLPAPPRSLLREASAHANRFAPPPTPPSAPLTARHETRRRVLLWTSAAGLLAATAALVAIAVAHR